MHEHNSCSSAVVSLHTSGWTYRFRLGIRTNSYTGPCHEAPTGGIRGFCQPHTLKRTKTESAHTIFAARAAFDACYLHAQTAVDAGDIRTWRITVILITGKPQIPPIGAPAMLRWKNDTNSWIPSLNLCTWGGHSWVTYAGFRLACRSPLCRYAPWSPLAVSELQLSAATLLWLHHRAALLPSWIEFNCLRSAAVGKAARLSIYWLDAACRLVIPLRQVALAQLYKYHHQSGNAASGKLVWNQHKFT